MKIYVITAGDYSDYHIEAVFSEKPIADEFVEKFNSNRSSKYSDEAEIEEWELDKPKEDWVVTFVRMKKDGTVMDTHTEFNEEDGLQGYDTNGDMMYQVYTEDAQRAIKVANEKRVQIIANNEWGKRTW